MKGREKQEVRRAAARLAALGRISVTPRSDEERLRESLQSIRNEDVYEQAQSCAACQAARQANGDATALCAHHLMRAMGG